MNLQRYQREKAVNFKTIVLELNKYLKTLNGRIENADIEPRITLLHIKLFIFQSKLGKVIINSILYTCIKWRRKCKEK